FERRQVAQTARVHHTYGVQTSHRLPHVRRVGSYALERLLATGGSAEIYLARQLTPTGIPNGPQVALKLPLRASPEQLDSLRREATALRSIEHPNVVRLLADGSSDSPPYLAMEYVLGVDLHQLRQRSSATQGAVPFDLACYVCREVALALQCVHEPTPQD